MQIEDALHVKVGDRLWCEYQGTITHHLDASVMLPGWATVTKISPKGGGAFCYPLFHVKSDSDKGVVELLTYKWFELKEPSSS